MTDRARATWLARLNWWPRSAYSQPQAAGIETARGAGLPGMSGRSWVDGTDDAAGAVAHFAWV